MWKVTRKGLIGAQAALRAHRDRGDPRRRVHLRHVRVHRDDPADVRRPDREHLQGHRRASCAAPQVLSSDFGPGQRPERARVARRRRAPDVRASRPRTATCSEHYAQVVGKDGKVIGGPEGAPTFGLRAGIPIRRSISSTSCPAAARRNRRRDRDRQGTAPTRALQGRRPRHGPHRRCRRRTTRSSGSRSSAPPTTSRARRSCCSRCPKAQRIAGSIGQVRLDQRRRQAGRRRRSRSRRHHGHADRRTGCGKKSTSSPADAIRRRTRTRSTRRSASSTSGLLHLRAHRAHRRRVHHLQHVLDRRRATHARDGAAPRDRREPATGARRRSSVNRSSSASSRRAIGVVARHRPRDRPPGADERARHRPSRDPASWCQRTRVVIGMLVGTVVTLLSAIVPARKAARVPPIAALRDVALERPINQLRPHRDRRRRHRRARRRCSCSSASSASVRHRFVFLGAVLIFVGVFVLGPLFARGRARGARRTDREHQGHHRHARPRERGAEPAAHLDHRRRVDDRRRARRLHHGVRRVGEGVVPRRDRPTDHERLHHQQRSAASAAPG